MDITPLPFNLKGQIYRSCMPYSRSYDLDGQVYAEYRKRNITTIVLLAGDEECLQQSGRDLRRLYLQDGYSIIFLPILDYHAPDRTALHQAVEDAAAAARSGRNLAIHCHAGLGRTGMFSGCLARSIFGMDGDEAIQWVRQYIPGAIESEEQKQAVRSFHA